jgi:hypothetical protein
VFDIGRKKKEDGIYFIGQNADDVTGSCTYIKYNGKKYYLNADYFKTIIIWIHIISILRNFHLNLQRSTMFL